MSKPEHCKDCCCARAWEALGGTTYTGLSIPEHIAALRHQLATVTQERDEAREDHSVDGKVADQRFYEIKDLKVQLAASQARCVEVEEALKLCVKAWDHDGEPSAISYEMAIEAARKTERPPA